MYILKDLYNLIKISICKLFYQRTCCFKYNVTGLIYSIWTNWEFFKHIWIIVKWIMIVLQILFGTFVLGPCINNNVIIADQLRDAALTDLVFLENIRMTQIWGTVQTFLLLVVIVISI